MRSILIVASLLSGCSGTSDPGTIDDTHAPIVTDDTPPMCKGEDTYPPNPAEPMALGKVLYPYSWPVAIHRGTEVTTELDLANVPCAADPEIDWSPFDVLLFVSIPAW